MKQIILKLRFKFLSVLPILLLYLIIVSGCQKKSSEQLKTAASSINENLASNYKLEKKCREDQYFWSTVLDEEFNKVEKSKKSMVANHFELFYPVTVKEKLITVKKTTVHRKVKSLPIATEVGLAINANISIDRAKKQAVRIARARSISIKIIDSIIKEHTEKRLIGCLGPKTINVVMLNSELDKLAK